MRTEWEAWSFQETKHRSKEAFIKIFDLDEEDPKQRRSKAKATRVRNPGIEPKTIREWIKSWEKECYLTFSIVQKNEEKFRGYNGLLGVNPVKSR